MVRTAQAATSPAGHAVSPPEPAAEKPRKLTVADAVDQFESTTRAIEGLAGMRDEAKRVLLAHAEKTGKRTFADKVAVVRSGGSLVLDQAKVRDELGARLPDFQTRTKLGWTLKLLS